MRAVLTLAQFTDNSITKKCPCDGEKVEYKCPREKDKNKPKECAGKNKNEKVWVQVCGSEDNVYCEEEEYECKKRDVNHGKGPCQWKGEIVMIEVCGKTGDAVYQAFCKTVVSPEKPKDKDPCYSGCAVYARNCCKAALPRLALTGGSVKVTGVTPAPPP